jgi:hypothetical protein
VKAGFYVTAAAWGGGAAYVGGTTAATECPADTYRSGDATAVASASGDNACTACPYGLKTQEGVTGATSVDECLAPPGWGFNGTAANECGSGKYKEGWNKEACSDCGTGFETDATNSTSEGDCKVPPGFGASSADGGVTWTAVKCPVNTYGRSDPTYGRVLVECTKCMDNTWTQGLDTRTSASACVTVAGYGYDDGAVTQCDAGTYNVGNNTSPCTSCGVGKDTTADGLTSLAGATDPAQCLMAKGWESDGATGLKKCKQGYYKATISNTACTQCPNGTTTSVAGATALSGCDACRAGFGASSISASAPSCGICGSGKYSAPITSGGAACLSCPVPGGYNGAMVSRQVRAGGLSARGALPLPAPMPRPWLTGSPSPARAPPSPRASPPPSSACRSSPPATPPRPTPSSGTSSRCPTPRSRPTATQRSTRARARARPTPRACTLSSTRRHPAPAACLKPAT